MAGPLQTVAFLVLVAVVLAGLRVGLRMPLRLWATVVGWQALMGVLAWSGWFLRFDQPWRALPTVALGMLAAGWLARRPFDAGGRWLLAAPAAAWVGVQTFRLPLELWLYSLADSGVIGAQMSYAGLNYDITVGLSAPLMAAGMAWQARQRRASPAWRRAVVAWNVVGLLLLLNIVVIAVLSVPFPFQVFTEEPANRIVAEFPFVWLPTLLVPLALLAHIVSLRRAWADTCTRTPSTPARLSPTPFQPHSH